jgi:uncharacterized protein (DUF1697 family)
MTNNKKVALLRGVNIGGANRVVMNTLCSALESHGFKNVASYLNSGNILYTSSNDIPSDEMTISDTIKSEFGLNIPTIALKADTFRKICDENPFANHPELLPNLIHIIFVKSLGNLNKDFQDLNYGDSYYVGKHAVYLYTPNGYHKSKINSSFWEQQLNSLTTARNLNTVTKLLSLIGS